MSGISCLTSSPAQSSFGARGRGKPFDRGNNDRGFKEHSNDRGEGKPRGSHNPNFKPRS